MVHLSLLQAHLYLVITIQPKLIDVNLIHRGTLRSALKGPLEVLEGQLQKMCQ